MGHTVDVFTRRDNADLPEVVNWLACAVFMFGGSEGYVPKEALLPYVDAFTAPVPLDCQLLHGCLGSSPPGSSRR